MPTSATRVSSRVSLSVRSFHNASNISSLLLTYSSLLDMNSGPICAMVWEGRDAVKTGRSMLSCKATFGSMQLTQSFSHPRCHQPPCLCPWHHPWRLRHRCRPQRLPRFRHRRERPEGDCSLVQGGRGRFLQGFPVRLDLREGINCHSLGSFKTLLSSHPWISCMMIE